MAAALQQAFLEQYEEGGPDADIGADEEDLEWDQGMFISNLLNEAAGGGARLLQDVILPVVMQDPMGWYVLTFVVRERLSKFSEPNELAVRQGAEQIALLVRAAVTSPLLTARERKEFWTHILRGPLYLLGARPELTFSMLSNAVQQLGEPFVGEFNTVIRDYITSHSAILSNPETAPFANESVKVAYHIFNDYLDTQPAPRKRRG